MTLSEYAHNAHPQAINGHSLPMADEAQQRLEVEMIPGTEILSRDGEVHLIRGEKGGYEGMVLVPQPSQDPHDPLVSNLERMKYYCTS